MNQDIFIQVDVWPVKNVISRSGGVNLYWVLMIRPPCDKLSRDNMSHSKKKLFFLQSVRRGGFKLKQSLNATTGIENYFHYNAGG